MIISLRSTNVREVDCFYIEDHGQIASNIALTYAISRFYDGNLDLEAELVSGYIMILLNILAPRQVMMHFEIQQNFTLSGYDLRFIRANRETISIIAQANPRWVAYIDEIGDGDHRLRESNLFLVAASVILLSLGN
ncbi:hypothetical protein QE152_g31013 [Popillia japonica]|uniref:DNA mismatch repair proteins mutS family domain-containing protein n=1 Tax=Popillia japonica TaxID=7064 RepID=A0AAW1JDZ6_POPJA